MVINLLQHGIREPYPDGNPEREFIYDFFIQVAGRKPDLRKIRYTEEIPSPSLTLFFDPVVVDLFRFHPLYGPHPLELDH